MFKILLGFLPWILFSMLYGKTPKESIFAILIALVVTILFDWKELKNKFILSWGTLLFFIGLFVFTVILPVNWIIDNQSFLSNAALAVITFGSILIKKPFTLQYAYQSTPKAFWKSPVFIKINYYLSYIWGLIFIFSAMLHFVVVNNAAENNFIHQYLSFGAIILGVIVTKNFPDWYSNRQQKINNKNNPFLQGNFAPIREENNFTNLMIEGEIPKDFPHGAYFRNGPNPAFDPITYTYPFDGDGMIHGLYFQNGNVTYKNRYVKTEGFLLEQRAGKAIYGGIAMPKPIDKQYLQPGDNDSPMKNGAFVHVIAHANKILALLESSPAYELDKDLNTQGLWKSDQKSPLHLNAHVRIDPNTQELFAINYDLTPPYLVLHHLDKTGNLITAVAIEKPHPTMIHDFVITKNYIIIFDCPVVFDKQAALEGESILQWRENLGTNIALIPRDNLHAKPVWIKTDAFFVFHFANAFEENNIIHIDYVRYDYLKMEDDEIKLPGMKMYRMHIDLNKKMLNEVELNPFPVEFPTINLNYLSKSYRYIYAIGCTHDHHAIDRFDTIIKFDLFNHSISVHDFGVDNEIGEAVFVPATDSHQEDDGYLIVYVYSKSNNTSSAVILNARDIRQKPVATVHLPRRVPFGLHGSWVE